MNSFESYLIISIIAIVDMIASFRGVCAGSPAFANSSTSSAILRFAKYRSDY